MSELLLAYHAAKGPTTRAMWQVLGNRLVLEAEVDEELRAALLDNEGDIVRRLVPRVDASCIDPDGHCWFSGEGVWTCGTCGHVYDKMRRGQRARPAVAPLPSRPVFGTMPAPVRKRRGKAVA